VSLAAGTCLPRRCRERPWYIVACRCCCAATDLHATVILFSLFYGLTSRRSQCPEQVAVYKVTAYATIQYLVNKFHIPMFYYQLLSHREAKQAHRIHSDAIVISKFSKITDLIKYILYILLRSIFIYHLRILHLAKLVPPPPTS
jgi:hypothetical protein